MASGGYRAPTNPAPASGPGKLSKRTDGGPAQKLQVAPGLAYGEKQQDLAQERTAPMAQQDTIKQFNVPQVSQPPSAAGATGTAVNAAFGAATQRPNEPITHGVNIGPGGGSEVLPQPVQQQVNPQGPMTQMLAQIGGGLSGQLAAVYQSAAARGV